MAANGKKLKARYAKVGGGPFAPADALRLLKAACDEVKMHFDETVEAVFRLGIDPKKPEQQVRGTFVLPHGTGKIPRILVFAQGDKVQEAEAAGADFVGGETLAAKIKEGWTDFDVAIATPDMMKIAGQLGKILGPRGLMPNPKTGTVTFHVKETVTEFKKGKVEYRNDQFGNVAVPIGRVSFEEDKLLENFQTLQSTLVKVKPAAAKGQYIRGAAVSSTQGPGLKIEMASLVK